MSTRVRRARVAVTTVFFVNGLLVASVLSRLPEIKGDLGLDTAGSASRCSGSRSRSRSSPSRSRAGAPVR